MYITGLRKTQLNISNASRNSLPEGESVADFLIDVSSGRLEPENDIAANKDQEKNESEDNQLSREEEAPSGDDDIEAPPVSSPEAVNRVDSPDSAEGSNELTLKIPYLPSKGGTERQTSGDSGSFHDPPPIPRMSWIDNRRQSTTGTSLARPSCVMCDSHAIGKMGVTTGKVVQALAEAKDRSTWLAECWQCHFDCPANQELEALYSPPEPYQLPETVEKPSFVVQLNHQGSSGCMA